MKASDICVGDWVYIYTFPNDNPKQDDLFPAKVSAVSVFDIFFDPDDVVVELVIERTKGIASRPLDTCLPIELTEEILVKNGFVKTWNGDWQLKEYATIIISKDYYVKIFERIIRIDYVHELQHMLHTACVDKEITL